MVVFTADVHCTEKEPFRSAKKDFFNYLRESKYNNKNNTFVIIGDLFDKSKHTGNLLKEVIDELNKFKFKKIIIITGNHDNTKQNKNLLDIFKSDILSNKIEVIDKPGIIDLEGKKTLCLPHIYREDINDKLMKNLYENEYNNDFYDIVLGHFPDQTQSMFGKFIDISKIQSNRFIMGDIHIQSNRYVGPPTITRYDERGQENRVWILENDNLDSIVLPKLLDYFDIKYKDIKKAKEYEKKAKYPIFNVIDIPKGIKKEEVEKKLKKYKIRSFKYEGSNFELLEGGEELISFEDIKKHFNEFVKSCKIDKNTAEICFKKL